jgi:beta-carotene hydroxylase
MDHHLPEGYEIPKLHTLGSDLLMTTRRQRWMALLRPFLGIAAYALAVYWGLWWLTPIIVFLIFVAVVTVTHDVVHNTLGLSKRQTEWFLFLTGAVLLESGHAYRTTHFQHHHVFPGRDDPEGDPAHMSFWRAVLCGPTFLPRLWWWAYRRNRPYPDQCRWLIIEALWAVIFVVSAVILWSQIPALLIYAVMVVVGSWVYPLLTVHLPHRDYGDTPLTQTHTLRGRIIPALFLELTYHLEHHLYPQVPSHHLPELARRLDPFFEQAGVETWKVP